MGTVTLAGPTRPAGPAASSSTGWTAGRVVAAVLAALLLLGGSAVGAVGTAALVTDRALRSDDGWVEVAREDVTTDGYAAVLGDVVLDSGAGTEVPAVLIGDLRVRTTPGAGGGELFAGIARTSDVEDYLGRAVGRSAGPYGDATGRDPMHRMPWLLGGREPTTAPGEAGIWDASAEGAGVQELTWTPRPGEWSLVVMRADAARGVTADVDVAVTVPWLDDLGVWGVVAGVLLLVAGAACLAVAARRPARRAVG